jgi:hypothetical protein
LISRKAAGVIEMGVRIQDELYVGELKAELVEICFDLSRRLRHCRVPGEQTP